MDQSPIGSKLVLIPTKNLAKIRYHLLYISWFIFRILFQWFWCRLYDIISHYIICTNYFWVLVEGIYLRQLLHRASFGFSMGSMNAFLFVGWGAALVPTFVWVKVRKWSRIYSRYTSISDSFTISTFLFGFGQFWSLIKLLKH